jgi:DNA-binding beta-propeller fold protein YncE
MASLGRRGVLGHRARVATVIGILLLAFAVWAAPAASANGTIYWSTGGADGAIQAGNLDGSGSPKTLFAGETGPSGVAIDPAANKIYWGDFDGTVRVGNLDGTGSAATLFGSQPGNPSGVAIDPARNKIYWSDAVNEIRMGNLDGSGSPSALFTEPDSSGGISAVPDGVALDPAAGKLYWANFGTQVIRTGDVDDSGSAADLFPGGSNPTGVAIDPPANKIYWSNADGQIQVGNLDGSGSPSTLFNEGTGMRGQGVAVDPASGKIYWGNFNDVRVGNLDGSGSPSTLFAGVGAYFVAVQPASTPAPAPAAGEDAKCKKLRKKRKRQKHNLAKAGSASKRLLIQGNIKDTKKRLKKLACT